MSSLHAMSDLWIVLKQEVVVIKSMFLQIIMSSATSCLGTLERSRVGISSNYAKLIKRFHFVSRLIKLVFT